jgi:hypothetical protein
MCLRLGPVIEAVSSMVPSVAADGRARPLRPSRLSWRATRKTWDAELTTAGFMELLKASLMRSSKHPYLSEDRDQPEHQQK